MVVRIPLVWGYSSSSLCGNSNGNKFPTPFDYLLSLRIKHRKKLIKSAVKKIAAIIV